jgi:Ca-activated chloride channel family protein
MSPELTALIVAALAALAEWLHARRSRRVLRLAFGPSGTPRRWAKGVPFARVAALGALAWGLATLSALPPGAVRPAKIPEGGYRHLVVALDVSPSMQLADAGADRKQRRAQRASEVLMSVFSRIALEQVRISVVAFYNGAKPMVVDTYDLEVVRNIIQDLPLDYAFEIGKTRLLDGLREAANLARPWQPNSTTLMIVSDGDTVPDSGMPDLPASIAQVVVIGVGDAAAGTYIDGHQSRQDAVTLRQLAQRLRGVYHDANARHLASTQLEALARLLPLREAARKGRREAALAAAVLGATLFALLPVALAMAGSSWHLARKSARGSTAHRPVAAEGAGERRRATGPWPGTQTVDARVSSL